MEDENRAPNEYSMGIFSLPGHAKQEAE